MRSGWAWITCVALAFCSWATAGAQPAATEEIQQTLSRLRYQWQDRELPAEHLLLDEEHSNPRSISSEQAVEDVHRLFYLFSHGYSGYAFFADDARWQQAREHILTRLATRTSWRISELPELIRESLPFIRDAHVSIGGVRFADHLDFWHDRKLEVREVDGEYSFEMDGEIFTLTGIDGEDPAGYLYPSLVSEGQSIHRIAVLSSTPPGDVIVEATGETGPQRIELRLQRSDFRHFSWKIFDEDRIGGIPVLRIRSFGDYYSEDLERWVETADRLRDEPCVIVDVRGNRGGNERWPIEWIRRLTGEYANSIFIRSELNSRTTMAGRANTLIRGRDATPDNDYLQREAERYLAQVERFRPGGEEPFWTEPIFPHNPRIENPVTIIIITNGWVGSAGEGFVMRMSQAENVFIVGENTRGALTFGNVSLHRLPHSDIELWLPINFNLFGDLEFREEMGLTPDYWVPAADALNFAVAAVRSGTIPTFRPLPPDLLEQRFVREDTRHLRRKMLFIGAGLLLGCLGIVWMRRSSRRMILPGLVWTLIGASWIALGTIRDRELMAEIGMGMVAFGIVLILARLGSRWRGLRRGVAADRLPG